MCRQAVDPGADLIGMIEEDLRVRSELVADGSLFDGYHPRMQEVHDRHALRLAAIIKQHGWPHSSLVGAEAAAAAFRILLHAINHPPLLRGCLTLLRKAAKQGLVPRTQVAMLDDRIRTLEGRPQRYGTQFDWDENGQLNPLPLENPGSVEQRRRKMGLPPLVQDLQRLRQAALGEGEQAPGDRESRQREMDKWARTVGWRE